MKARSSGSVFSVNPFEAQGINNSSPNNVGYKPAQRRNPNMNDR